MTSSTQTLDTDAVARWMEATMGVSGPVTAEKFAGGQSNPTFRLTTPSGRFVLRRKPPGALLKSAHAVDREYRVQKALAETDVPVAKMHALCEDDSVIGSAFYVMEAIEGRHFEEPTLTALPREERMAVFDEMNRVLAAIHDVNLKAVGLDDYGPEGNYYRRQIDRWMKQYRASETSSVAQMEELMAWLDTAIPEEDGQRTLVHGDYRIDNMLFAADRPAVAAVLDWELSTIGHPYADLGAVIMQWGMPAGKEGRGMAGIDRAAEGLITDEDFIAQYCKRRGLSGIDKFGFYLAFNYFRMAGIIQGVYKRALDGNASNPERAMMLAQYVPVFAEAGLRAAKTV